MPDSITKYTNHPKEYVEALNKAYQITDPIERNIAYKEAEKLICTREEWENNNNGNS